LLIELEIKINSNRQDAKDAKKFQAKMQNAKHAIQNAKLRTRRFREE
jgi:hypothetical protein